MASLVRIVARTARKPDIAANNPVKIATRLTQEGTSPDPMPASMRDASCPKKLRIRGVRTVSVIAKTPKYSDAGNECCTENRKGRINATQAVPRSEQVDMRQTQSACRSLGH